MRTNRKDRNARRTCLAFKTPHASGFTFSSERYAGGSSITRDSRVSACVPPSRKVWILGRVWKLQKFQESPNNRRVGRKGEPVPDPAAIVGNYGNPRNPRNIVGGPSC